MGVELPLRVVVTILECCVTFSGVRLSIRSFVLFSESGKLILCGLKSLESLIHLDVILDVLYSVYPMNSLSVLLQYYDNYSEDNSIIKCLLLVVLLRVDLSI